MTRSERRLAVRTAVLGLLLTLLVVVLDFTSAFAPLERWLYDQRARHCQFFLKKPTDKIVYADIDDQSQLSLGRWPWPRSKVAEIVDEIRLAEAKVLAFDVMFVEPQEPTPRVRRTPTVPIIDGYIDHDDELARAVQRFGKVLVPTSFTIAPDAKLPLFD